MTWPAPPCRATIRGSSSSANIPRISRGTPGSIATQRWSPSSSQMPGADPCRFGRIVAPEGMYACCRFVCGISPGQPYDFQRTRNASQMAASNSISRPKILAMAAFVRSSAVGPNPPVVIAAPVRASASCTAEAISSAASPTLDRRAIPMPTAESSRAMKAAFVSMVKPSNSSSPIVTTSTFIGRSGRRGVASRSRANRTSVPRRHPSRAHRSGRRHAR